VDRAPRARAAGGRGTVVKRVDSVTSRQRILNLWHRKLGHVVESAFCVKLQAGHGGVVQPSDVKRIVAVVAGTVVLGGLIWLAVPSRTAFTANRVAVAPVSLSAEPETHEMPPNVVTMLGVPEVIVNDGLGQPSEANNGSAPPAAHAPPATHSPPAAHAPPALAAPTPAPKEAVRRAPTNSNTSLAKILSGQAPPPATRKPSNPAPRR
jgi:hypothetical protein